MDKKAVSQKAETTLFDYARLEAAAVLKRLKASEKGLAEAESRRRTEIYGRNVLVKEQKLNIIFEFLSKFKSPLVILLMIAAAISYFFGETVNAVIIGLMILLSATLDFIEEHNADKSVKKLLEAVKATAAVMRSGKEKEIAASQITIGDIIVLNSGDLVPADARLICAKDFFINQSALTGESMPCEKTAEAINVSGDGLTELNNIVFAGTNVVSGKATAVVVGIGAKTEFGQIALSLSRGGEKSEFENGITNFGLLIMRVILFLVLFIFLFNAIFRHQVLDSFMFAVAIAVGITPELLPMIMSITMARGSLKMAKKGVIVKKLSAIPSFGSMDILCTDKTGTLTEGKIALVKYADTSGRDSETVLEYAYLNSFYQTGIENPLDKAVIDFKKIKTVNHKKVDEIPFDFVRKRMSVVVENGNGRMIITKGAPEEVFSCCSQYQKGSDYLPFNSEAEAEANAYYKELSEQGYRVLALATKQVGNSRKVYTKEDEAELCLDGFIAFLDPPKAGTKEALVDLEDSGIEIKVITGDNEYVARKVCQEIGLKVKGVLLGKEIERITDDALRRRVEKATIFARFSPDDKNRVILALRANKHIVGFMGDGINDAPSIRTADVGISVNNAVDVAKESADIVLTRRSLRVLHDGVIEGRKSFGNTMKYIMMGLSSNFGNMFSAAGAVVFLPFLPMLPIQILLNNFIYDISQVTITTDNVDEDWVKKARRWNIKFIKNFMFRIGPISSFFDFATFFLMYYFFHASASVFQTAWFIESLATQTLVIHIIRTKKIPFFQSMASWPLLLSTFLAVAVGWLLPFTAVGRYFGFVPLPPHILAALAGIVIVYLFLVEVGKRHFYHRHDL